MVEFSPDARRVLEARYLRRDAAGRVVESPEELLARVARGVAHAELRFAPARVAAHWEAAFHDLLAAGDFLPSSPTLMNAGTALGQLAACFVLPVGDTMEEIFDALRGMALVQRTGGGTGFSFSTLRPCGARLRSTGGEASGPVSFLRIFDAATEHVRLGGRRRGANMAVLRVDHPNIIEFIEAKRDGRSLQHFNLSVGVTDEFIEAKRDGRSLQHFNLSVGVTDEFMEAAAAGREYPLVHRAVPPRRADAGEVFRRIVEAAWATGDPGLVFLDAIARANPVPALGRIEATNPCGEVPLLPWESCVLGSVNLARMVREDGADLDWERLRHAVRVGVRFLDDVVEITREPLPAIAAATRRTRKIGLGVMGFAEMLLRLGVSYADADAVAWADRVCECVAAEARAVSRDLAGERGPFPAWPDSVHAARGDVVRNATCLSIAPTGTLAIIAGTTSGIEPLFALAYRRAHSLGGEPLVEVNPVARRTLARLEGGERLLHALVERGSFAGVPGVPDAVRHRFATALEVSTSQHLRVQQAVQRHVDNAVAKTVNLPETATPDDVAAVYREAWQLGLKGVTVYRYGSKSPQVLTLGAGETVAGREAFARCDPAACRL